MTPAKPRIVKTSTSPVPKPRVRKASGDAIPEVFKSNPTGAGNPNSETRVKPAVYYRPPNLR